MMAARRAAFCRALLPRFHREPPACIASCASPDLPVAFSAREQLAHEQQLRRHSAAPIPARGGEPAVKFWRAFACSSLPEEAEFQGDVVPIPLAQPGEGIAECELLSWHVAPGQAVEAFAPLCEVQSDKATVEITSRYSGRIVALHYEPGAMVPVGQPLVDIQLAGSGPSPAAASPPVDEAPLPATPRWPPSPSPREGGRAIVPASPAARRLAKEAGLDLAAITGSGPGGHVTKADVLAATTGGTDGDTTLGHQAAGEAVLVGAGGCMEEKREEEHEELERQPLRGYARAMVTSMKAAAAVPHFYFCDEIRMDGLVALRARLRAEEHAPPGLTYLPFLLKAASAALADFPALNCQLSADERELLRRRSHNLGVAIATPSGLVVPNIKGVQGKSIGQIAEELLQLQERAAAGKLTKEDLSGGSLTVSNVGSIGGTYAMPLLNTPEAAIVALGRVRNRLELDAGGGVQSVRVMNISWGADHRVVDGATLAGFSNAWKRYIEQPETLLLRLR